jgi:hypothetical protein
MLRLLRRSLTASIALALTVLTSQLSAQAVYGAVEVDDDEFRMFFLGGSWGLGGMGWKPYASVSAFNLSYPSGSVRESRNVVVPSIGLRNTSATQSVNFGVGYAFADEDFDQPVIQLQAESGDGFVASAGWNHWGSTNTHALQLLGSYNFGTEFLWTRGRASKPLTSTSPLWVGGELALLGGGLTDSYIAQFGPTVEWRFNPQFRLGGSAGLKTGVSNASGFNAVYGRLEFLWLPSAR